jgi:hypothetical protein
VAEQQNIADALSRRRDLQLAVAFAFSTGRISFNQLNRFRRQLDYEAATIALNRTVTAFAQGNEMFGWRFAPRYQTPPEEESNLHLLFNMLYRGGPGRNYQVKNSKLEAGQRELTAIVILPSFLQRIRVETTGNWFRLHDPDEITLSTPHMLEQGRRVMQLRHTLGAACDVGEYRPDDLQRLVTRVRQIESMLPMQTLMVSVPYGNSLSGFDLFTQGSTSLAPELVGYQGVDVISDPKGGENSLLLFGKNFSIQETKVVAGGQRVEDQNLDLLSREILRVKLPKNLETTTTHEGKSYVEIHLATPNGISNRLLVPLDRPDQAIAAPPAPVGYTLLDDRLSVTARLAPTGQNSYDARSFDVSRESQIRIVPLQRPDQEVGNAYPPASVTFRFTVEKDVVIEVTLPGVTYEQGAKSYVIGPGDLKTFAAEFLQKLHGYGKLVPPNGLTELTSKRVEVTVQVEGGEPSPRATANQLHVDIELVLLPREKTSLQGTAPPSAPARPEDRTETSKPGSTPPARGADSTPPGPRPDAAAPRINPPGPGTGAASPPRAVEQPPGSQPRPGAEQPPATKKAVEPKGGSAAKKEGGAFNVQPDARPRLRFPVDLMLRRTEALPPLPAVSPPPSPGEGSRTATPSETPNREHQAQRMAQRGQSSPSTQPAQRKSRGSLLKRLLGRTDRAE